MKSGLGPKTTPPPLWTKSINFFKNSLRDAAQKTNQTEVLELSQRSQDPPPPTLNQGSHHRRKAFYLWTLSVGGGGRPPPQ